jgi:zinc transporter ZupT
LAAGFVHLLNDGIMGFANAASGGKCDEGEFEDFPNMAFACSASVYFFILLETGVHAVLEQDVPDPATLTLLDAGQVRSHAGGAFRTQQFLSAIVIMLALCIHSFLAGFDIGADPDSGVLIAILGHKTVAGIALGASILSIEGIQYWKFWVAMTIFSLVTPVGVLVGEAMSGDLDSKAKFTVVSITAGMFVYVSLMEIVRGELEKKEYRVAKALFMGVGWGFMSMVALWT